MNRLRPTAAGVLAFLFVLLLASCGGSSDSDTTAYPPLIPRGQYEKKAKAICDHYTELRGERVEAFYERRQRETGATQEVVGAMELINVIVVPTLKRELGELEAIGLPEGKAYDGEAVVQTLSTVVHEVEVEGIYAWRKSKLLPPFRNRSHKFGLDNCIIN
ncbi:MAG TPA: hypothetical protein VNN15_07875 [Solirubrobacterales bacterium]|nr:hypothetical protein [Solirubrobacterales bacterium]